MKETEIKIAVVALGKICLPLAVQFADKGVLAILKLRKLPYWVFHIAEELKRVPSLAFSLWLLSLPVLAPSLPFTTRCIPMMKL